MQKEKTVYCLRETLIKDDIWRSEFRKGKRNCFIVSGNIREDNSTKCDAQCAGHITEMVWR